MTDEATAKSVIFLCKEIQQQNKNIAEIRTSLIDSLKDHPDVKIIETIKGLGLWTAVVLRMEYGSFDRFYSADAAVAFAGLDPRIDQSGDMLRNLGISRAGRSRIRSALYMPTLAAIRWNPVIHTFYNKLIARGEKKEKVAQIACMRKLIHIIYACVITARPFDPNYQNDQVKTPINPKAKLAARSPKASLDQTAPISRKEAKKRKAAAALPQKDQRSLYARSRATAVQEE